MTTFLEGLKERLSKPVSLVALEARYHEAYQRCPYHFERIKQPREKEIPRQEPQEDIASVAVLSSQEQILPARTVQDTEVDESGSIEESLFEKFGMEETEPFEMESYS